MLNYKCQNKQHNMKINSFFKASTNLMIFINFIFNSLKMKYNLKCRDVKKLNIGKPLKFSEK